MSGSEREPLAHSHAHAHDGGGGGEQVRVLLEDAEEELLLERGRLDVQERAPDRGRVLVCLVERPFGALGRGGAVEGAVHDDDRGCLLVDLEDVRDLRWGER